MKDIGRLLIALTLIAAGAGLILSLVEGVTREPIKEQRRIQMLKALSAVLPEFDNSPDTDIVVLESGVDKKGNPIQVTFYRGRQAEQLVGTAFKVVAPDGYSGNIEVMIGVKPDETLQAIEILAHAETPGLGSKITESWFKELFKNKGLDNADWRVKKDGGEFDQITGATISPRAIVGAIQKGLTFYRDHKQEIVAAQGAQK
ncbi:MAG: RnfABCDGE type electron transport complex subunit G [Deltaproteobacteria bacterium]|jgi:electron transport complex protein RnfG|nr:RnfABCDGE type electron transport complex subunit G [Deltaproteobacteria bacterium]MCW8894102.1 RnfABCDGE type electron transport complex subunit G [Deltaproteobacteria bacterium]MCW9049687.1 RnfABCDGE type electron transport complex subunit G [Deltaproteobacteria bacterium]